MKAKDQVIDMINNFKSKRLSVIYRLTTKRDNDDLLFKFVLLDTLEEQILETIETKVENTAIVAFALMELIDEDLEIYFDDKKNAKD